MRGRSGDPAGHYELVADLEWTDYGADGTAARFPSVPFTPDVFSGMCWEGRRVGPVASGMRGTWELMRADDDSSRSWTLRDGATVQTVVCRPHIDPNAMPESDLRALVGTDEILAWTVCRAETPSGRDQ